MFGYRQNLNPVRLAYREGLERTYGLFPAMQNQRGTMSWKKIYNGGYDETKNIRPAEPLWPPPNPSCPQATSFQSVVRLTTPFVNACNAKNIDDEEGVEAINAEPLWFEDLRRTLYLKTKSGLRANRALRSMKVPVWTMNVTAHVAPQRGQFREERYPFATTVFSGVALRPRI